MSPHSFTLLPWSTVPRWPPQLQTLQKETYNYSLCCCLIISLPFHEKPGNSCNPLNPPSQFQGKRKSLSQYVKGKDSCRTMCFGVWVQNFHKYISDSNVRNCLLNDMWLQSKQFIFLLNEYLVYRNGKAAWFSAARNSLRVPETSADHFAVIVFILFRPRTPKRCRIFCLLHWIS